MAHFVDWQELDEFKSNVCRPIDELAQDLDVADSKIVIPAQTKERCENPRDFLFRRKLHSLNR